MAIQMVKQDIEIEQERRQIVEEMVAENGPNWLNEYKPGSFGCHELLDRTAQAAEAVERSVLSHPACALNQKWYLLAEQAANALRELYQRIGEDHLRKPGNEAAAQPPQEASQPRPRIRHVVSSKDK